MSEQLQRLEEKIAYLERHVTEQDKAMLEMSEEIVRLKRDLKLLVLRLTAVAEAGEGRIDSKDERPPHY